MVYKLLLPWQGDALPLIVPGVAGFVQGWTLIVPFIPSPACGVQT